MGQIFGDLRFALRTLWQKPGFTLAALLALALGTGANCAIFSIFNTVLLRPLPYSDPHTLVMVWGTNLAGGFNEFPISLPDFIEYQNQNSVFQGLTFFSHENFTLTGSGETDRIQGTFVAPNFFTLLGSEAAHGRTFRPEGEGEEMGRVVVLGHNLWRGRFGGDTSLIGRILMLNGTGYTVLGVMSPDFQSPNPGDQLWAPMSLDGSDPSRIPSAVDATATRLRNRRFLVGLGRLRPGMTLSEADAQMKTLAGRLEQDYPDINKGIGVRLVTLDEQLLGNVRPALLLLLAAAAAVLLIACANVANLLLARSTAREREIVLRAALGATRGRIIRQLLTESLALALLGGILGLLVGLGGLRLLLYLNPIAIPRFQEVSLDLPILGFGLALVLATGILFGLAPALKASRPTLSEALQEGGRGTTVGRRLRLRGMLVVAEVALAQLLLIGAGLMLKSLWALRSIDPGFQPRGALTFQLTLPPSRYSSPDQMAGFYGRVLEKLQGLPGVQSVGAVSTLPLSGSNIMWRYTIDGRQPATPGERLTANFRAVNDEYFRAMGLPVRRGRAFTQMDHEGSPPVVIINETLARTYWPDEDPLGRKMTIPSAGGVLREIVGVAADVRHSRLEAEAGPEMYVPYRQRTLGFMGFVLRASGDAASLGSTVRQAVLSLDPEQPVYDIKTLEQFISDAVSQPRLSALLLAIFAVMAILLATIGIYGVISFSINQRRQEIGIRMALGAQPGSILRMVVGQAMLPAVVGVAAGMAGALAMRTLIASQLHGVSAADLTIFTTIAIALAAVALVSSLIPAARASRMPPMDTLRAE